MTEKDLPPEFVARCKAVKAKRAKTVIDHLLKHGEITTEQLKTLYGYDHPPRAARDVKEQDIPITMKMENRGGTRMGVYRFGDPTAAAVGKHAGRKAFDKALKASILARDGARCAIYSESLPEDDLQVDHRIPFEVWGGGENKRDPADYMLLSRSANRAKSWSCEHCENWQKTKDPDVCRGCYWAFPDSYTHVAMRQIRRLDILWVGEETGQYDTLKGKASDAGEKLPDFVKDALKRITG